jgi:hypothetical protein
VTVANDWSTDARGYQARISRDLNKVSELGERIPRQLEVTVPFQGQHEILKVNTRPNGGYRGRPAYDCVGLSFMTNALGISAPVYCSILANIDRACSNPSKAIEQVVIAHVHAIASSNLDQLSKLPQAYKATKGPKGALTVAAGEPDPRDYHRPAGVPTAELYSKPKSGAVVTKSPSDVSIELSSGTRVHTTSARLQHARGLAAKISFLVRDDGSQVRASEADIEKVAQRLSAFSVDDIKLMAENGYKVLLVNSKVTPRGGYPGGRAGGELAKDGSWEAGVGGYVDYDSKVLVMPTEALDKAFRGADVMMHELAHVTSDCREKDTPSESYLFGLWTTDAKVNSLDNDATVVALFQAYANRCGYDTKKGRKGTITNYAPVWSSYAVQGPQEYLAEGIAFYKHGGATRQKLKDKDPGFHARLEKMFPEG